MKRIDTQNAFTLIEVIIASILASVVILGLFSIYSVLQNNNQDYAQRSLLNAQTQATLTHILNNASLAVGSATNLANGFPDLGVLVGLPSDTPTSSSFCIHQAANNNIIESSSDIWLCYTFANNQINYCTYSYPTTISSVTPQNRGADNCSKATSQTYLGTAFNITNPSSSVGAFGPLFSGGVFSITIQNCIDNTSTTGTCNAAAQGSSSDPVNNPEVVKTGSVIPVNHGVTPTSF